MGCQDPSPRHDLPSDSVLVRILFDSFSANVRAGSIAKAQDLLTDDYLHQGYDRASVALWLQQFLGRDDLRFSFDQFELDVQGDKARVDYFLQVESCTQEDASPAANDGGANVSAEPSERCDVLLRCRSEANGRCGQWRGLRKIDGVWRFAGDQEPYGIDLTLRASSEGVFAVGQVRDPERKLTGVQGSWKGTDQELQFESHPGGAWAPVGGQVPEGYYPSAPLPWVLSLTLESASGTRDLEHHFLKFNDQFATELQPNGEAVSPFVFRWTHGSDETGGSQIEIGTDSETLWRSPVVHGESLAYGGPNLPTGETVQIYLLSYDLFGNSALTTGILLPVDGTDITPSPTRIEPSSAAAMGGTTVTIHGSGFLTGVSVLFGSSNGLEVQRVSDTMITCITPALTAGSYNVIVANPAGQVGVLEQAYTALDLDGEGN